MLDRFVRFFESLLLAIWVGGGILLMAIAAPAAFRHAPDSRIAGDIVGGMLSRWRILAILIPIALLGFELARGRARTRARIALLIAASILAASQIALDARVHRMRMESPVPISSLSPADPVRRQFGMLHGVSWMLMLTHVIVGAGVLQTISVRSKRSAGEPDGSE